VTRSSTILAAGAAAALAAALAVPAQAGSSVRTVAVKDDVFGPRTLTIPRGATVRWAWKGHAPHNVTVTKGPVKFRSSTKTSGRFTRTLTRKGTYTIICTIHQPGMKMTLKVS